MANSTDKSILTAAGKALLAQLNAEEKALVIDKMIFANVPNRPEYPQPDDVVPTDHIVHQEQVEQRGRLSADSVIYSTTLTSDVGPFDFNWTGAYCSEYGVLVTIDHHALTPKTADEPGVAGNTLVRSVVLEYKDIAEITNITVDASSWQYNATERMKKMDSDVAQSIIDQNGKDWFIEDGFLVTPSGSAYNIKAGAGYVSGNRVAMEFDRSVQVPNKPSFIYIDAHREGTPTGEQVTLFNFVVTAEEKDDYIDSSTGKDVKHFVCKIAQVHADGSVSDLRPESSIKDWVNKGVTNNILPFNVFRTVNEKLQDFVSVKDFGAVGDGIVDDTDAIQAALNTKKPVFIPGGKWKITRNLTFYAGQTIEGVSNPEKSLYVPNNTTHIIVDGHVGGLEHRSVGLANGARFKDFTLKTSEQHQAGSGTQGLEIGKWGGGVPGDTAEDPEAWKYQAIRLTIDNVMIQGFDVNASFWGWCWEMSFNRFYTFKDSTSGARFGRGVTGVNTLIQCSFLSSNPGTIAGNLGGTSLLLDQGASITCFNCRWEGADGTGIRVKNGSKLEAYTPYFESNFDFDVLVSGTKCDVKIIGGESDYGHTHTACLSVKEDEENAPHNIIFKDFKHNAFDPVTMKPKFCSWFITNPYANVRLENIDDNTDVPFLDFRLPPDYMTFSKFPGVTLRSNRSNVSERKLPWNQGGAKIEVDGNSLPASLVVGYDGFDLIQQVGSGIAHVGHRRYALHNDKWIISAPLSYRNIGVRNMSSFPATVKIEDFAGIKIYRYTGQASTAELTLDLTNAMVGMDFEITIEKTDILPTSITLKDQMGTVIDTIEPGANGFYGKWVMTNFQGSGITFKKMMAMPY
ncbi:phage tail protein [Vibrio parahaemolyticus]